MMWGIQTKERGVPMKAKLAYFVSKIDRRYILLAYFAFAFLIRIVMDSPMDGGVGPT
jgi:hypothetical protein